MTSGENSTSESEEYSGLNLGLLQSLESGDITVELATSVPAGEVGVELPLDGSIQSEDAKDKEALLPPPSETAMQDYFQLQQNLLGLTIAFGVVIFPFVWGFYSWQIALDYILGALAGVVYLRMLGKNVSNIGRQKKNSSAGRLAVFAGIMIVALRWEQLDVVPVFLGFLTYKAAIIAFVIWTSVMPYRKVT